jgi:adenosylcobinamide-phosphate synthase
MVSSEIALTILVLIGALIVDLLVGDPRSRYHPVALLGGFIGMWGKPDNIPPATQRLAGVIFWFFTAGLFAVPFILFSLWAPWYMYLLLGPFLLKICFAWRSLEEHTLAVKTALIDGVENGREQVKMLVSRDTATLDREHILSAGYESLTENLTDSIISPLSFFCVFGLGGAAVYRAANTMDAMLGYRDKRERLGWCAARMDDILNFIPARITVILLLLYFFLKGHLAAALRIMKRDRYNRPGYNGGIVMAVMAGGTGVKFEKPGVYTIGDGEISFDDGGLEIMKATRAVVLFFVGFACCTLFLLGTLINSIGI